MAGWLVTAVGLVALTGWSFGLPVLIQGRAGLPAISPQTALAFIFLGTALVLARRLGGWPTLVLALAGLALGLHGVAGHVFGANLLVDPATAPVGFEQARQMSLASAIAVSLSGAAIAASIAWRRHPAFDFVASLTGSAVMLLGVLGIIAQIALSYAGSEGAFAWMSVPAALGCLFLGWGLLMLPRRVSGRRLNHLQRTIPIVVTLATAMGTVFLWQALDRHDRIQFEASLQDHAEFVASDVRADLAERKEILVRVARRLEARPGAASFDLETRLVMNDLRALDAVVWDHDGERRVAVRPGSGVSADAPLPDSFEEALAEARGSGEELVTRRSTLEGRPVLLVGIPMAGDGEDAIFGAFHLPELLDGMVSSAVVSQFGVTVGDDTGAFYRGSLPRDAVDPRLRRQAVVPLRGVDWWVSVSPSTSLARSNDTALPETVLGAGLILSVLLGASVHLFGLARRRASTAEAANRELALEIEERRRVEQALRDREVDLQRLARRLEQSNEHLDRFASAVAHDLKEPLITVGMFAEEIAHGLGEAADPETRDYLLRIQRATERMRRLIESVLALSRVTSRGEPFAPVDLSTVLATVTGDLRGRLEATGGRVEVGVLPIVDGDAHQLQQLFQNLVANALKFCRDGIPPEVRVRWEGEDGAAGRNGGRWCRISVSDNGIGFTEEGAAGLFQEFQRLPGTQSYEGHGLGLAISRRIVERHGGAIRARPGDGSGAVIEVDLPLCHTGRRRTAPGSQPSKDALLPAVPPASP